MKLSICIPTYNRADFIVETLESIVPQVNPDVELLIFDGASPDNTEEVIREYIRDKPFIRYHRATEKASPDADFDATVDLATGDYCWLFPDDDLLAPGAVARVLGSLAQDPDVVIVDGDVLDVSLAMTLRKRRMAFEGERSYSAADSDRFIVDMASVLSFIGAAVIRRNLWLSRDRKRYYGSYFLHVGVILQAPLERAIAIGEPLVRIRYGNSLWTPKRFEIWGFRWPELIRSFEGYSDLAKENAGGAFPWKKLKHMASFRARGAYSYEEYRKFFDGRAVGWRRLMLLCVALFPGRLAHILSVVYFLLRGQISSESAYELVRTSPYSNAISRRLAAGAAWHSLPLAAR